MASSVLEELRQKLEDIENLEKAGAVFIAEREKKRRHKVFWEHCVVHVAKRIKREAHDVLRLIKDEDFLKAEELALLGGQKELAPVSSQPQASLYPADSDEQDGGARGPGMPPPPPPPSSTQAGQPTGKQSGLTGREVWRVYYDRIKQVQDYYKKFASLHSVPEIRDAKYFVMETVEEMRKNPVFSPAERYGNQVDLVEHMERFVNFKKYRNHREAEHRRQEILRSKKKIAASMRKGKSSKVGGGKDDAGTDALKVEDVQVDLTTPEMKQKLAFVEIEYVQYLQSFHNFQQIPRYCKYREPQYLEYVEKLYNYLQSFFERRNALMKFKANREAFETEFERAWNEKRIEHWSSLTATMQDVYALATDRLFATKEACDGHKGGKQYKAALANLTKNPELANDMLERSAAEDKRLARLEFLICKYRSTLQYTVIEGTVEALRKRQSRRLGELEADWDEAEEDPLAESEQPEGRENVDSDSDEEDQSKLGNPLNVPLGFDGKPIPFWLYKLHGLGQEFKCEICGNYSYWGRKVFERHFQEWRHAFGMRCLKIPNTVHFKEITSIEEAINLFDKLKSETEAKSFLPEKEIEIEDQEGNVMTLETFDDLRRQGIL